MVDKDNILSFFSKINGPNLATVFELKHYPRGFTFGPHKHKAIEINIVQKGDCYLRFGNDFVRFKKGDCMVIFPNVEHYFAVETVKTSLLQLEFELDIFPELKADFQVESKLKFLYNILTNSQKYMKIVSYKIVGQLLEKIIYELKQKRDNYQYLIQLYYAELFIHISRHIDETMKTCENFTDIHLNKAVTLINNNYCNEVSIEWLAKECGVSSGYLRRIFKAHFKISPIQYILQLRINKAKELLLDQEKSTKEIAYITGFSNLQYFCRVFKDQTGIPTSEYRKRLFQIV